MNAPLGKSYHRSGSSSSDSSGGGHVKNHHAPPTVVKVGPVDTLTHPITPLLVSSAEAPVTVESSAPTDPVKGST